MKRSMFLLAGMLSTMLMSANDNVTLNVTGKNMTISLENQTAYCGFQMDFELPEGMSITSVEKGTRLVTEEGSKAPFDVDFDKIEGNTYRIIVLNDDCQAIEGNTGDLLTVEFSTSVTEQITATNIHFVLASNLKDVQLEDAEATLPEEPTYIVGDANGDNKVTVLDYLGIAKYILQGAFDGFNVQAADVNDDGKITVLDYLGVAKIILNGSLNSNHRVNAAAVDLSNDCLTADAADGVLAIGLNNAGDYSMYQLDVTLPTGAELIDVAGTERMSSNHTIEFAHQYGTTWRILVGSRSLATVNGSEGDILRLNVSGLTDGEITIDNAEFVTPALVSTTMRPLCISVGQATGITNLLPDSATEIYNLQGVKVNASQLTPGVYMVNGKKYIVK